MHTAKRGMKNSKYSGKKPANYLRDLKRKKGHLEGNKLLIKLDLTPRLKKEKNPFNEIHKPPTTTASKVLQPSNQIVKREKQPIINSKTNLIEDDLPPSHQKDDQKEEEMDDNLEGIQQQRAPKHLEKIALNVRRQSQYLRANDLIF